MCYHKSMIHGKLHLQKSRFLWNQSKPSPIHQGLLCPALCTLPGVERALKLGPRLKERRWGCVEESSYVYCSRNRLPSFEHRIFISFPQEPFVVNFTLKFPLRTLETREWTTGLQVTLCSSREACTWATLSPMHMLSSPNWASISQIGWRCHTFLFLFIGLDTRTQRSDSWFSYLSSLCPWLTFTGLSITSFKRYFLNPSPNKMPFLCLPTIVCKYH